MSEYSSRRITIIIHECTQLCVFSKPSKEINIVWKPFKKKENNIARKAQQFHFIITLC